MLVFKLMGLDKIASVILYVGWHNMVTKGYDVEMRE